MSIDTLGVPKKVLRGSDKRYITIHKLYVAKMLQELFRILHESFWARARTGSYKGLEWAPLSKRTLRIKRGIEDSGELDVNAIRKDFYEWFEGYKANLDPIKKKSPRMLTADQKLKYDQAYETALKATKSRTRADTEAWKTLASPPREFADLIGIRTGRLVAATMPGPVSNNRYYPNEDQRVKVTKSKIEFSVDPVPHATAFAEGIGEYSPPARPILPDDLNPWILVAHQTIMQEVRDAYEQLKARYTTRELAKTPIRRLRKRSNNKRPKRGVRSSSKR